jgi:hypothetical protein
MKFVSLFNPVKLAQDPEISEDGDLYYNTTIGNYRLKLNGVWSTVIHNQNIKLAIAPDIFTIGDSETASATTTLEQYYSENILYCVSASLTQIIIPNQENTSINVGSRIGVARGSEGIVEIIAEEEVDFSPPSNVYLTSVDAEVRLINVSYNKWIMTGEFPDLY